MGEREQYTALIRDLIKKQGVIVGPEIATLQARQVRGLMLDDAGEVIDVGDDPLQTFQNLITRFARFSGGILGSTLSAIFAEHPALNLN